MIRASRSVSSAQLCTAAARSAVLHPGRYLPLRGVVGLQSHDARTPSAGFSGTSSAASGTGADAEIPQVAFIAAPEFRRVTSGEPGRRCVLSLARIWDRRVAGRHTHVTSASGFDQVRDRLLAIADPRGRRCLRGPGRGHRVRHTPQLARDCGIDFPERTGLSRSRKLAAPTRLYRHDFLTTRRLRTEVPPGCGVRLLVSRSSRARVEA